MLDLTIVLSEPSQTCYIRGPKMRGTNFPDLNLEEGGERLIIG